MEVDLTEEQTDACERFLSGMDLKINAFAGTGKTTTLKLLAHATDQRGLYICFNRANALAAKRDFPSSTVCHTSHQEAFRYVASTYGYERAKFGLPKKAAQLVGHFQLEDLVFGDFDLTALNQATAAINAVKAFCQGADPILEYRHVPIAGRLVGAPRSVVQEFQFHCLWIAKRLWVEMKSTRSALPMGPDGFLKLWSLDSPRLPYDFVMLDEAQDTNGAVLEVLRAQDCQCVYAGDKFQQIYEWRGAVNAMQQIDHCDEVFLTNSFRFGPAIASAASLVLRYLGEEHEFRGHPEIESAVGPLAFPDCFLARTNASVMQKVLERVDRGRSVHVLGGVKELRELLEDVQRLKAGLPNSRPEFFGFGNWKDVVDYSKDEDGLELRTLVNLVEQHGERRLLAALSLVTPIEETADLVVSTAHKAKGREWETVQLSDDFILPKAEDEEVPPPEHEARLFYVAMTRARIKLDVPEEALSQYLRNDDLPF